MKKMLMINGSPRSGGNSAGILKKIADKVSAEYECETVDLGKLRFSHCIGCMSCKKTGKCALKDDMTPLYDKIQNADAIAFCVPVYFSAETGLFKNFIDRLYALLDRKDGKWSGRFGKPKKGIVAVNCGAPDGNMIYGSILTRLVVILGMFGVSDVSSAIVPDTHSGIDGQFMDDLLDAVDFQMSL